MIKVTNNFLLKFTFQVLKFYNHLLFYFHFIINHYSQTVTFLFIIFLFFHQFCLQNYPKEQKMNYYCYYYHSN